MLCVLFYIQGVWILGFSLVSGRGDGVVVLKIVEERDSEYTVVHISMTYKGVRGQLRSCTSKDTWVCLACDFECLIDVC